MRGLNLRGLDFSSRAYSTLGRDHGPCLFNDSHSPSATSFPPYSIEQLGANLYRLTLVVAGFSEHDLQVENHNRKLLVRGCKGGRNSDKATLWQRLTGKIFHSNFLLAEHVSVLDAQFEPGLLHIELQHNRPHLGARNRHFNP